MGARGQGSRGGSLGLDISSTASIILIDADDVGEALPFGGGGVGGLGAGLCVSYIYIHIYIYICIYGPEFRVATPPPHMVWAPSAPDPGTYPQDKPTRNQP